MKRIIFTAVLICFFGSAYSQAFSGGVSAGFVASQLDGDNLGGYHKPGVRAGGWVNTRLGNFVLLQLELEYTQKGSKISEQEYAKTRYYHSRLNYVQLPFLAKIQLYPKIFGEAGVAVGYLESSAEDKDGYGFLEATPPFDEWDFSGILGLSYEFNDTWMGTVRFNYSILPVREHPGGQVYWVNRGQYNNAVSFSVFYKID
jgi:hypothetical protein